MKGSIQLAICSCLCFTLVSSLASGSHTFLIPKVGEGKAEEGKAKIRKFCIVNPLVCAKLLARGTDANQKDGFNGKYDNTKMKQREIKRKVYLPNQKINYPRRYNSDQSYGRFVLRNVRRYGTRMN
ncbi:uncharacterized protein LOC130626184 [Hydractinia symbiolongicarpus]|uniref:uncharacterized protein LOC130626184 n=1 Tax=Hydractinia symbiolongicarpus TaxID=13093 RepID=UPI00254D9FA5|nr:uncharacterized protein LOC130626184 [Hydractinia symbiolongicarpus]